MKQILSTRTLIASLLALTAFGAVFGSAASLGGLDSERLGAGASVVASCDTDGVKVSYEQTYSPAPEPGYKVTEVTVSGVADACDGQTLAVTLADSGNASLGTGSLSIPTGPATSHTVSVAPSTPVGSIANAHVVIS